MGTVKVASEHGIEDFLGGIDPSSMRDAAHLREIAAARRALAEADQRLRDAVAAARAAGDSWAAIGVALRTSKQNAYRKFGADQPARANVRPSSGV
ncbi:hypothetical protein [Microbacterium sp.]|uniref:hypothetical protein n=1 Tax=Microbacterium sp. TaxID=51671 RepID=UPI0039E64C0B